MQLAEASSTHKLAMDREPKYPLLAVVTIVTCSLAFLIKSILLVTKKRSRFPTKATADLIMKTDHYSPDFTRTPNAARYHKSGDFDSNATVDTDYSA